MSYGVSHALQTAVFQALATDAALAALVGTAIYDAPLPGGLPSLYVVIGPEKAKDASDKTGRGAEHDFSIEVISDAAGFSTAKAAAGAVSDVLIDADLALSRGRLVSLGFVRAVAERTNADLSQITLTFRARVEDTPV